MEYSSRVHIGRFRACAVSLQLLQYCHTVIKLYLPVNRELSYLLEIPNDAYTKLSQF